MRVYAFVMMILLAWIVTGCTTSPSLLPPEPTATPIIPSKQPEPSRPRVGGEILDVPDDTLATVHILTPEGWEAHTIKGPFPGLWESVITEANGVDYIVIAEADGYISQPISYTIHISGDIAYVVQEGKITDEEAVHLDFCFVPEHLP